MVEQTEIIRVPLIQDCQVSLKSEYRKELDRNR
jgi:hypothetical protein